MAAVISILISLPLLLLIEYMFGSVLSYIFIFGSGILLLSAFFRKLSVYLFFASIVIISYTQIFEYSTKETSGVYNRDPNKRSIWVLKEERRIRLLSPKPFPKADFKAPSKSN